MSFTDIVFLTYWKQDPPPAKRLWLTLSCYSLNCDGLEPKLQYLWGMQFPILWMEKQTQGKWSIQGQRAGKQQSQDCEGRWDGVYKGCGWDMGVCIV